MDGSNPFEKVPKWVRHSSAICAPLALAILTIYCTGLYKQWRRRIVAMSAIIEVSLLVGAMLLLAPWPGELRPPPPQNSRRSSVVRDALGSLSAGRSIERATGVEWRYISKIAAVESFADMETDIDGLISHPFDWSNRLSFLPKHYDDLSIFTMNHDDCAFGGELALAGHKQQRDDMTQAGIKLIAGCIELYNMTDTGLPPKEIAWYPALPDRFDWHKPTSSIEILDSTITIGPEIARSLYYAYEVTRDPYYQETAWALFETISRFNLIPGTASGTSVDLHSDFLVDPSDLAMLLHYIYRTLELPLPAE